MDVATIIGSILGWLLIVGSILIGPVSIKAYFDLPSVFIVFGGALGATLVGFPLARIKQLPSVAMKAVTIKETVPKELIKTIVGYAEVARRDGILSLESLTADMDDEFIVRGIQMAVDGTDPELIEQIMEAELENQMVRHATGKSLFEALGKYAPAFGMIGTLIGLVAMLANMTDPAAIGKGMAAALLTTLYGACVANLLFLPIADKLGQRAADEVLIKTIIIQGVMSIQSGDNPRIVEQKLLTFIPPSVRAKPGEEDDGAKLKMAA